MILLPLFAAASLASIPAEITVDASQEVGTFDRLLASSGDEMSQNMTWEGLDSLVGETGVEMLRMGGIAAEYYDWEGNDYNGLFYVDIGNLFFVDTLESSLDDMLQLCEKNGISPILTVNYQLNDPGKAARMVEYCNGDTTTAMGSIRASRGHPEPYNVTYWSIGNEPDIAGEAFPVPPWGYWTFYRHFGIPFEDWASDDSVFATAEDFAQLVGTYVDSMRVRSPIPISICGLSLAGDMTWLEPVIGSNCDRIDWMDIHNYPVITWSSDSASYRHWLSAPTSGYGTLPPMEEWYPSVVDSVDKYSGGNDIPVWVMEYNLMIMVEDPVWWNYLDGLYVADCIGHMSKCGVPVAGQYSIAEGDPEEQALPLFGAIRTDTLSMRASAWALKLYSRRFGETVVEASCDQSAGGYGLEVYASRYDDWTLSLMAINKDLDSSYAATIELSGYLSDGTAEVWQITNDQPMGAPWNGTSGISYQGEISGGSTSFSWTFPKASITCLWIHPDPGSSQESPPGPATGFAGAFPNPFRESVELRLVLDGPSEGFVDIFDACGRRVRRLEVSVSSPGTTEVTWRRRDDSGRRLPAGVYLARLVLPGEKPSPALKLLSL
ncbi:hypothetical protein GF402_09610 [Candidatus Fermentibacteria bacterium]|nr:hypothetical protein [Candidatus Fermentibacteria bacterium]